MVGVAAEVRVVRPDLGLQALEEGAGLLGGVELEVDGDEVRVVDAVPDASTRSRRPRPGTHRSVLKVVSHSSKSRTPWVMLSEVMVEPSR